MPHAHYEYGPFGEPLRVTGPAASLNPFRFSTKRTDPTTALVLYEYRVYSPTLGRWLSRDPVGELRGQAAYGFCTNDSVDAYDLFGLCDGSCGRLVGILAPSPIPAFPFPIPPPVPLPTPGSPAHKAACDTAAAIARSFLTSPEEIRAWDRFVSGKAPDVVELTREEMGSVLSAAPKFQADLSVQAEECKTALSYWSDRTKQIDDSIGSPWTRALGQVTITVTTLCGCRALAWKACIDDKYDFDPTWFRGGRTRQAEVETILVWLAQNVGFCGWKEYRHKGCQDGIIAL
jgi:RHS repeat-associated protein